VLHLSTRWGFASLRKLALRSIKPPTPFDQLLLARAYSVDHWVLPALSALCERTVPLSLNEARQMGIEDVVLVTTVREDIRHHALQVDSDEIPYCIEAAQAGMHAVAAGLNSASPRAGARGDTPTSPSTSSNRTTERSARPSAAVADNVGAEGGEENDDDAKTAVATSPVDVRRVAKGEKSPWPVVGAPPSPGPNAVLPSAEKPFLRPTSAWGKILVVPSPTLSLAPNSPVWDDEGRPRRHRIASARRPSPPPVPPKAVTGGLSDSDGD
jgi:hypothetical protein